ncbi:hypothetical protein QOT17_000911 [Balamuthia mandrillaris]
MQQLSCSFSPQLVEQTLNEEDQSQLSIRLEDAVAQDLLLSDEEKRQRGLLAGKLQGLERQEDLQRAPHAPEELPAGTKPYREENSADAGYDVSEWTEPEPDLEAVDGRRS